MFNLTFSFATALWALPLAGVPILLHLLFRQKSPVVQFSTLRFIKMSVQRTAARRRVQKWMLLVCRALLLALLIWAIAQPAVHSLSGAWMGNTGQSTIAAVVIDTSYSMQFQDGQVTLLNKADGMVQDLLRNQLAGAKVAIFQSASSKDKPEQLRDASAVLADWSALRPQPTAKPLVDRVAAATALLDRQPAEQKWLVVLSDFQSQEFPHPMPEAKEGRTVLLDLHPTNPRSAGITRVTLTPAQPIPGIPSEATVEVTGQPGDARPVKLVLATPDGNPISESATAMATLDSTGRAKVQFPLKLPAQRWIVLTGMLTTDDAMPWDNQRSLLVEVPPRQRVDLMQQSSNSLPERFVRLALDPSEGGLAEWPLAVSMTTTPNDNPGEKANVAVAVLTRWPTADQAVSLRHFAEAGHNVILFLSPGLESSWGSLPTDERESLLALLPSAPIQRTTNALCRVAVADAADPLLQGLTDDKYQLRAIVVRQMVSLAAGANASTILNAVPADPQPGSRTQGLLFRKNVGAGVCFTIATLPDPHITTLATHPTFLPLMVRMSLRTAEQSAGQNVELGQPLVVNTVPNDIHELQIESPQHEQYRVPATKVGEATQFIFNNATEPGLYIWRAINNSAPLAISNVSLPGSESELSYRPAQSVAPPGPDTVIATSVADLSSKVSKLTEPKPQWSTPLAIVMFLLCLEALMGSWPKMWKAPTLRAFSPASANA